MVFGRCSICLVVPRSVAQSLGVAKSRIDSQSTEFFHVQYGSPHVVGRDGFSDGQETGFRLAVGLYVDARRAG